MPGVDVRVDRQRNPHVPRKLPFGRGGSRDAAGPVDRKVAPSPGAVRVLARPGRVPTPDRKQGQDRESGNARQGEIPPWTAPTRELEHDEDATRRRVRQRRERPCQRAPGHRRREDRQPAGAALLAPVCKAPPTHEPESKRHVLRQVPAQVVQRGGRRGPEQPGPRRHPDVRETARQQEQETARDAQAEDRRQRRSSHGRARGEQERVAGRVLRRQDRRHEDVILLEEFRQGRTGSRPPPRGEDLGLQQVGRLVVAARDGMKRSAHEIHLERRRHAEEKRRRFPRESLRNERGHARSRRADPRPAIGTTRHVARRPGWGRGGRSLMAGRLLRVERVLLLALFFLDLDRVDAGEAGRAGRLLRPSERLEHALDREVAERVGVDVLADLLDRLVRGDQLRRASACRCRSGRCSSSAARRRARGPRARRPRAAS